MHSFSIAPSLPPRGLQKSVAIVLFAMLTTLACSAFADITVPGTADPYLAGLPDGATAKGGDTAPAQSPVLVKLIDFNPGDQLLFSATGATSLGGGTPPADGTPDGSSFYPSEAENNLSGCTYPLNALVGVFLNDKPPVTPPGASPSPAPTAPPSLDFSPGGNVPGGVDYTKLSPQLRQIFFIGNGKTSGGTRQKITVPNGATRLFLANTDGFGWYNNTGSFRVQVTVAATPSPTPPQSGLSATVFTVNGSNAPSPNVADTVLRFAAQQTGTPAGLVVRVQASTSPLRPTPEGSWKDLPNGSDGHMTFDKAGKQFVLNTTDYPLLNGVSFRCISSADGYPDSISNVVGLFDLASAKKRLGATELLIDVNGFIADMFFRAYVPASPNDLALRIQATTTPAAESSWTDLNNGSAGRMAPRSVPNQFFLLLNDYPPAADLYFRVVTSARGFVDNLSAARGPFTLIKDVPPVVTMIPPKGLTAGGDGSRAHPIVVSAGSFTFGAKAASKRQLRSFVLQFDGSTIQRAEKGVASVKVDHTTNVIGLHQIEAIAIDDLGGRARAGTDPLYINVVPSKSAANSSDSSDSSDRSATAAAASPLFGKVFTVARSGGVWDDPSTWVDANGKQGVPGISDFAIVGSSSVQFNKEVSVYSLSISGGRLVGPGYINVYGLMTLTSGSVDKLMFVYIQSGAKFLLTNSDDVRFDGILYNYGTLAVHGSGGVLGMAKFFNHGVLNWITPQQIHPRAGIDPVADKRIVAARSVITDGFTIGGVGLIGQDGSSLVGEKGTGFRSNDGGILVHKNGGTIVGQDGTSLIGQDGTSLIGQDGTSLISEGGSGIVATDGATLKDGGARESSTAAAATAVGAKEPAGYFQTGGETDLSAASITGTVTLNGGVLSGSGVINGNLINNKGYVAPGHSTGVVSVMGNFVQRAAGSLILENGGRSPSQFDQLQVYGAASLDGRLDVRLTNGYTPTATDTFNPLGYKSVSGQFSSISANAQVALKPDGMLTSLKPGAPNSPASKLLNISTRMRVEKGDNALIGGFIVTGTEPKKVIIRALGPTLPVDGKLLDPTLALNGAGVQIFNNNWKDDQAAAISATGIAPKDEREAAIVATLQPGMGYTAVVRGNGDTTGVGLVEVYDLDSGVTSQLANISTRGLVQTGDNVMIGGLIIGGATPVKTLVRALGPSLTAQGIRGALQDPELELIDGNGNALRNDDWLNTQESEIEATGVPPPNRRESAIVATLVPGFYTAIVRGKNETTGIGLIEAYNLQ